jgi:hypothetical protein
MTPLRYVSGEEILPADRISYHGDFGDVEFVLTGATGNALRDWYLQGFPQGGLMIRTAHFGRLFVSASAIDYDLLLVSRAPDEPPYGSEPST